MTAYVFKDLKLYWLNANMIYVLCVYTAYTVVALLALALS